MEVYNESTDQFEDISGDTRGFPNLYPGFHMLPNHIIFYSRTGFGSARAEPGVMADNQSGFFTFSPPPQGSLSGSWTNITAASVNRAKGMSVMILRSCYQNVRILAVGGVDSTDNNTYEIIDASVLSPSSSWNMPVPFPDRESRRQCNAVLLPDGTVFVSGGIDRINSPCALFNPANDTWDPMDELPSIRGYHSVSLLLPSGKVLVAGGDGNPRIEIFSPPYLFRGTRPIIVSAPSLVQHGQTFSIETREAESIVKTVLVRPMAVTHQTDTEQRVIEMPFLHDHARPNRLVVTAPDGGRPRSLVPDGYYMLFILNRDGVPSVAHWVGLSNNPWWRRFELATAGASTSGGISAVSRIPGSMEVWWIGANGSVQGAKWYEGGSPWELYELAPAGSASTSGGISAVSRIPGSMEVWWIGANGSVQDAFWYA